ncbi:hypothetical protein, partial [Paenibacillus agaridevorans]|uniref:hypothetical protein n=1 Tax=Paenibacillus agaridevorans TaxID=171404 RepID=UPI001C639582
PARRMSLFPLLPLCAGISHCIDSSSDCFQCQLPSNLRAALFLREIIINVSRGFYFRNVNGA